MAGSILLFSATDDISSSLFCIFLIPFQLLSNCLLVSRTFIGECGRIFTPGQDQDSEQAGVQGHHVSVYSGTSELDKIPACLQTNALSGILIQTHHLTQKKE